MKRIGLFIFSAVLLISATEILPGCKKDKKDDPKFVVTATPVEGWLQFSFYCSTDDVKMTKVTIQDPLLNDYVYNTNGETFVKNELWYVEDWFQKQLGTWTFTFVGNFADSDDSFTTTVEMQVTGK